MMWKRLLRTLTWGILSIVIIAHLLFGVSLVGFGLRSDGWVLHPVGVAWYGLFVLGSAGALLYTLRTAGEDAWLPMILAILALAVVGAYPATSLLGGTRYAPYDTGDLHEGFVSMNFIAGLAMAALALLYRRPRLLLSWSIAQGILLVTYPAWWGGLWRWGALGNGPATLVLTVGLPLLYALTANALGVGLPKRWTRHLVVGLGIGVILVAVAAFRHGAYLNAQDFNQGARAEMTWGFVLGIPVLVAFCGLLAPLPLQAARMLGEQTTDETRRFPWEILALVIIATTPVLTRFMQPTPGGMVPAAGQVQAWRSPDHVVPAAWLPTLGWSGWLLRAARWLLIPYALVNLGSAVRRWDGWLRNLRTSLTTLFAFPHTLLGAGLLWVAVSAWDAGRMGFPLHVAGGVLTRSAGYPYPIVPAAMLLFLAGRALESEEKDWRRWTWRWLSAGGLLGMVVWTAQRTWRYGRILIAPLPAWTAALQWDYAPLPRVPLSALGLALHLALLGFGVWSLSRWMRAVLPLKRRGRLSHGKLLPIALPLLALIALTGLGWWVTTPRVVATIPQDGSSGVPLDVTVSIRMQERAGLRRLLNVAGFGISAYYADTGAYIPSMSGGSPSSLRLDPESPLRPGAPVEVTVHRAGERPYTLHFTTAPAEDVLLINKWHYELMEADYQYFSVLVRAAMADPAVIELNAMVSDDEDNLLFDIGAMLQEQVENSHSVEAFQDLPGKNPWGETDKPVYKKLLPSEMKAMNVYAGQYAGDCSSISHLTVALCRMNGIPEDDIFVLRTKQHSLVLVQYQSVVYMINDTYVDELSPVELFFVNLYWNTGLYNDRYAAKAGYVLSKDKLSGPGTLKEKFERHYNVQFRDMQDEWTAEEVEALTNLAMQKRSTPIADVVSASERGPLVSQLFPSFPTIEASVDWLNENVGTGSIFPYDAFMTPDQVIVFKTASPFDKALFLVCYCRIKGIACEMLQSGEETYVIRAASKAYLVGETITETKMENDSILIPVYRF